MLNDENEFVTEESEEITIENTVKNNVEENEKATEDQLNDNNTIEENLNKQFEDAGFEIDKETNQPVAKTEKPKRGVTIFLLVALGILVICILAIIILNAVSSSSGGSCSDSSGCRGINYVISLINLL